MSELLRVFSVINVIEGFFCCYWGVIPLVITDALFGLMEHNGAEWDETEQNRAEQNGME